MEKELREKFEAMLKEPGFFSLNGMLKEDTMLAMELAYNLAKQEYAEMIKAQSQLLQSMGETNKQLAKRVGAINDLTSNATYGNSIDIIVAIKKVLNP